MLIDEIEAAAQSATDGPRTLGDVYDFDAVNIVEGHWWPRLKAALEAAREMDTVLTVEGHDNWSQRKFREAMGE